MKGMDLDDGTFLWIHLLLLWLSYEPLRVLGK